MLTGGKKSVYKKWFALMYFIHNKKFTITIY